MFVCSEDICDTSTNTSVGNFVMCPNCDGRCDYFLLHDSCYYAKITYIFDNNATVIFAFFMSVWGALQNFKKSFQSNCKCKQTRFHVSAVCFLEFWKRQQTSLQYDWDVAQYELEEVRPDYFMNIYFYFKHLSSCMA